MENYYFDKLNKEQQKAYTAIKEGLTKLSESFKVPKLSNKELSDIYFQVRLDNPKIFYTVTFTYRFYPDSTDVEMIPEYMFTFDKIREHQAALDSRIRKLARAAADLDDVGKELYIHDFVCQNVHYDKLKKPYSHEIIGPLTNGVGVCEGIAKTVKALCDELHIWCIVALAEANAEKGIRYRHAWNVIRLGGKYYNLDATFDNTLSDEDVIRYDYFNIYDKSFYRDHEPLVWKTPECVDNDRFYYKVKKLSFTTMEDVRNRTAQAVKKGRRLTFHWRGGYLSRDILTELFEIIAKEAAAKNKQAMIGVNRAQAVLSLKFVDGTADSEMKLEEANVDAEPTPTDLPLQES